MVSPHDKLIAAAAKEILAPLGFRRKGRSRLWIGDHGWWASVVEFQPRSGTKGSYLNVAAHWLWIEKDYLSFDYGGRVEPFIEYTTDIQFQPEAARLAQAAACKARELSQTFNSIEATATVLAAKESQLHGDAQGSWSAYHAGIAMGLAGRTEDAGSLLRSVRDERVRSAVARVEQFLSDPREFRREVDNLIATHRKTLGLAPAI